MRAGALVRMTVIISLSVLTVFPGFCRATSPEATPGARPVVGFIYVGPIGDVGWSWAHDQGRQKIVKELGVTTTYMESVAEGPEAERALRALASKGCDIIFATSFGYMDSVTKVAAEYPKVLFEHCTGYKRGPNVGIYDGRGYECWYLAGMVAGSMTKKNAIGYLMPYPIPECTRNCNAFELGARRVNPKVTCRIVVINTWFDPVKEREAAQALIDAGVDVLARESDSNAPDQLAQQRGVFCIGYNAVTPDSPHVLTAPVWDWRVYYRQVVLNWRAGLRRPGDYWGGIKDGIINLAPFSPQVPADVQQTVLRVRDDIRAGTAHPFTGPVKDRDGTLRVKAGEVMSDDALRSMDWLTEGVLGSLR